jgi:hypothetical protein
MNYDNLSIEEILEFIKTWGVGFKELDYKQYPKAEGYYHAMIDVHFYLSGLPLRFYNLGGLKLTVKNIAKEFLAEYTSKRQDKSYKERAELLEYIEDKLLKSREKVIQTALIQ